MDLYSAIRELYDQKKRIDFAIAALEAKESKGWNSGNRKKRRGRKGMSADERVEVSRRMRAYWASRRNAAESPQPESQSQAATA